MALIICSYIGMFYGAAMDLICIFSELSEPKSLNYAFRGHAPVVACVR